MRQVCNRVERRQVIQARSQIANGIDPIDYRAARKAAAKAPPPIVITFRHAAEEWIKHRGQSLKQNSIDKRTEEFGRHVYPMIGDKPIDDVEYADVKAVLDRIWFTIPATAVGVMNNIKLVLQFAHHREWRTSEKCYGWKGCFEFDYPPAVVVRPPKHYPALALTQLGQIYIAWSAIFCQTHDFCRPGD